jgi:hypothetical protein
MQQPAIEFEDGHAIGVAQIARSFDNYSPVDN